jgi:hypothetical protein
MTNLVKMTETRVLAERTVQREVLTKIYDDYSTKKHNVFVEKYNRDLEGGAFESKDSIEETLTVEPELIEEIVSEIIEAKVEAPIEIESVELPLYTYVMKSRGLGINQQPAGHVSYIEASRKEDGYHGLVSYNRALTKAEMKSFELAPYIAEIVTDEIVETEINEDIKSNEDTVIAVGVETRFMGKLRKIEDVTETEVIIEGGTKFDKGTLLKIGGKGFGYDRLIIMNDEQLASFKEKLSKKPVIVKEKIQKASKVTIDPNSLKVGDKAKYMGKVCDITQVNDEIISIHYSNPKFTGQIDFSKTDLYRMNDLKYGYNKLGLITPEEAEELLKAQNLNILRNTVSNSDFSKLTEQQLNLILEIVNK